MMSVTEYRLVIAGLKKLKSWKRKREAVSQMDKKYTKIYAPKITDRDQLS